jgi:hypothetical protein
MSVVPKAFADTRWLGHQEAPSSLLIMSQVGTSCGWYSTAS